MQWILIGLGLIVGLILLVVVVGMFIPKAHVASRKARFNQTPEIVFDAITERGEIYNPIFRVFARFVFGYTATMETYLKQLGTKFGQVIEPNST